MTAIWNNPAASNGPAHAMSQGAQQGPPQAAQQVRPGQPGQAQPQKQGDAPNQQQTGPEGQAKPAPEAATTAEATVEEAKTGVTVAEQAGAKVETRAEAATEDEAQDEQVSAPAAGDADADQAGTVPAKAEGPSVKGQIEIADEVVEKVSALAALEVEGVADLGGDIARVLESVRERIGVGQKRGDQGVKATITGDEVTINLTIVVEYGHVVMEVARNVQSNVAVQARKMLGLRIAAVNVKVDDVQLPAAATVGRRRDDSATGGEGAAE